MWILIALILISLVIILGLVLFKVKKIRRGTAEIKNEVLTPESILPKINFGLVKAEVLSFLAKWSHVFVLILLKLRIKLVYFLKRKKEIIMPRVKNVLRKALPKNPEIKKSGVVSKFLKNISDYKKKLKKIEQKMKEEEVKKTE